MDALDSSTEATNLAPPGSGIETELKFLDPDLDAVRRELAAVGARLESARRLEVNVVFDTEDGALSSAGKVLRLRDGHELTVKLPVADPEFKARQEITVRVDQPGVEALLDALGYRPRFRYQKYREGWDLDGMWVTLDELPFIGAVVEVEGARERILEVSRQVGLGGCATSTANYRDLFLAWAAEHGYRPGDLTFEAEAEHALP